MKQLVTEAIILSRTDYGEADRILTLLTPDHGKLSVVAKGVRRVKSKLAGGIELFSVSRITFIQGRSTLHTLVSTRLERHYGEIVKHIDRTMLGYELIRQLHRATEDTPEPDYFELLRTGLEALNTPAIPLPLIQLWFSMQLVQLGGHAPNLQTDTLGQVLQADRRYNFSFDEVAFTADEAGRFSPAQIKFLRLGFAGYPPATLHQIQGSTGYVEAAAPLVQTMLQTYIRV